MGIANFVENPASAQSSVVDADRSDRSLRRALTVSKPGDVGRGGDSATKVTMVFPSRGLKVRKQIVLAAY